jgi:hypothetical protein
VAGTHYPNTAVRADAEEGPNQFFEMRPRINQKARLNAAFVVPDTKAKGSHRIASEWDNPVWGWLVVNYCDYSIMVFNPDDGAFVCEVLLMRDSSSTSVSLQPETSHTPPPAGRLAELVEAMHDYAFSEALFNMLSEAAGGIGSTTADYADLLPAALGAPFCLVDFGCSIELAQPPATNQSLLAARQTPEKELTDYEFSVVVGNPYAAFDGLVGTFSNDAAEIAKIYTGYGLPSSSSSSSSSDEKTPLVQLAEPLKLKPFFIPGDEEEVAVKQAARLRTLSAIVDPVRPIHIYSGGVFPLAELSLPSWAVSAAMRNLRASLRVGPLLVPGLPPADTVKATTTTTDTENKGEAARAAASTAPPPPAPPAQVVQMPFAGVNQWEWLQPRLDGGRTVYDPLAVAKVDEQLKVEEAASMQVVEGYAMLKKNLQKADMDNALLAGGGRGGMVPGS